MEPMIEQMQREESTLLARAIRIAAEAHETQVDKAGAPYILHPLRLMMKARTPGERLVAVLHDVVEDSPITLDSLRGEGFPEEVVAAVDALTHREGEPYEDAIERAAADPLATAVKFYDLEDNMMLTRLMTLTDKDLERVQRYHRAHQRLMEARAQRGGA